MPFIGRKYNAQADNRQTGIGNLNEGLEGWGMIERRRHPRVKASHPVLYFTDIYPRPRVATTVDLSMGGTRIETPYSLVSGADLEMTIAIHPRVIKCTGQVVHTRWVDGERLNAGVRFEDMSKQDRLYLGEYISHVVQQPN